MPYKVIVPKGSAPPLAPYSPGTKAGNVVYVSGTLALDSNGTLVGKGDVKAQTRHILETIKAVLEAAGGSLKDVTFNQIWSRRWKTSSHLPPRWQSHTGVACQGDQVPDRFRRDQVRRPVGCDRQLRLPSKMTG
jgi:enamine deaminase RidA (YjgF/YER057c/UK114 family)